MSTENDSGSPFGAAPSAQTRGESAEDRVARGAAWLDEHRPGWERMVDLARLDMTNGDWCICGQAEAWTQAMSCHFAWTCGFLAGGADEYEALDAAWRPFIKNRFDTGLLSDTDLLPVSERSSPAEGAEEVS